LLLSTMDGNHGPCTERPKYVPVPPTAIKTMRKRSRRSLAERLSCGGPPHKKHRTENGISIEPAAGPQDTVVRRPLRPESSLVASLPALNDSPGSHCDDEGAERLIHTVPPLPTYRGPPVFKFEDSVLERGHHPNAHVIEPPHYSVHGPPEDRNCDTDGIGSVNTTDGGHVTDSPHVLPLLPPPPKLERVASKRRRALKVEAEIFECRVKGCGFKSKYRPSFKRHMETHERTPDQRHRCMWAGCDKSYAREDHLRRHERIHKKQWDWKCDLCDAQFTRKDKMKAHRARHERFKCEWCAFKCMRAKKMDEHICQEHPDHISLVKKEKAS